MTEPQKNRRKNQVNKHLYQMFDAYAVIGLDHKRENVDLFCNVFGANTDKKIVAEMLIFFAGKIIEMAEEMKQ